VVTSDLAIAVFKDKIDVVIVFKETVKLDDVFVVQ